MNITLPITFLELEGDALRLYLFLLKRGGYQRSTYDLAKDMGMTRQRLRTCLLHLTQKGLINPKATQVGLQNYSIINPLTSTMNVTSTQNQPKQETENEDKEKFPPAPPIKEKEEKEKEATHPTYIHACVREIWLEWLAYKQQRGDSYKTDIGARRAYSHAYKTLAGCDAAVFADIVAQSIRHEWLGLFPLHRNYAEQTGQQAEVGIKVFNTKEKDYIGW